MIYKSGIDLEKTKKSAVSEGKFTAVLIVLLVIFAVILPFLFEKEKWLLFISAFFGLGIIWCGSQLLFHATTLFVSKFEGNQRNLVQIFIALISPTVLSLYFLSQANRIGADTILGYWSSYWTLFPVGLACFVAWAATPQLDKQFPFRGYLIATAICFVIAFLGHHGFVSYDSLYDESSVWGLDKSLARSRQNSGMYLGRFVVEVAAIYVVLTVGLLKGRNLG